MHICVYKKKYMHKRTKFEIVISMLNSNREKLKGQIMKILKTCFGKYRTRYRKAKSAVGYNCKDSI